MFDTTLIRKKDVHMIKKLEQLAKEMRLLYVDDNYELCETYTEFFQEIFKEVDCAHNGYEGLQLFRQNEYDLVITDINMPRMNGFSLIREIQKIRPDQRVIVVSAYSEIAYLSNINACHVDYFLVKPVDTKDLMKKVYECLEDMMAHQ